MKNGIISCCIKAKSLFLLPLIRSEVNMRTKVILACTECKQRNYNTMKDKKNTPNRLELKKYCKFCKKHTLHRETR